MHESDIGDYEGPYWLIGIPAVPLTGAAKALGQTRLQPDGGMPDRLADLRQCAKVVVLRHLRLITCLRFMLDRTDDKRDFTIKVGSG